MSFDPAVLLWFCLVALAFLLLVSAIERWQDRSVKQPRRSDQRISAEEMRLTGTDYRDHVAGYFRKVSRRRQIVRDVTEAD
jgi:hypothetical protein